MASRHDRTSLNAILCIKHKNTQNQALNNIIYCEATSKGSQEKQTCSLCTACLRQRSEVFLGHNNNDINNNNYI